MERNEAVVWTPEPHDASLWLKVVRQNTAWLGLISFSISSVIFRVCARRAGWWGGGRMQHSTKQRKDKHRGRYRCAYEGKVLLEQNKSCWRHKKKHLINFGLYF